MRTPLSRGFLEVPQSLHSARTIPRAFHRTLLAAQHTREPWARLGQRRTHTRASAATGIHTERREVLGVVKPIDAIERRCVSYAHDRAVPFYLYNIPRDRRPTYSRRARQCAGRVRRRDVHVSSLDGRVAAVGEWTIYRNAGPFVSP
ncbi:hypothetical protein EVAR_20075_1 [Eumeta japonica]|uniref:Uncharacterized protein n=1 Tax=Eumeta variegata TaxID=151549 RepID=A0A4C1UIS5_EUMVA|nr:hypothetical protein EVAR_20075_1 [Eumeta japonica]